jgi:hypothetical protein
LEEASSSESELSAQPKEAGPRSQHQPFEISSDSDKDSSDEKPSDEEPRRSRRVKKVTRTIQSQQEQIQMGLIPTPGAKAKARTLNAKKKRNMETSQLKDEFELV